MSKFSFKEHKTTIITAVIACSIMIALIVGIALMWKPNKPADEEVNTGFSTESEDETSATVSDIEVPDIPEDKTESKEADITVEGNPNGGEEEPEPLPPVTSEDVNEPQWTEAAYDKTMYVTENCNARKIPILGAEIVKAYKKGTQVHVIAKTSTSYYKLEDETFIHQNYLSLVKPAEEQPKPPVTTTPDEPVDIASLPTWDEAYQWLFAVDPADRYYPEHGTLAYDERTGQVLHYDYYRNGFMYNDFWQSTKNDCNFTKEQLKNLNHGDVVFYKNGCNTVWCKCGDGEYGHLCHPAQLNPEGSNSDGHHKY